MAENKKVSGYTNDFGHRLKLVVDKIGNLAKAGAVAEIKPEMVGKWRDGDTKPPLFPVARLCVAAGVSVDWLLFGTEESSSRYDEDVMVAVATALEQYLFERDLIMPPASKGKAIVALYNLVMKDEGEYQSLLTESAIDAFLKSASGRQ